MAKLFGKPNSIASFNRIKDGIGPASYGDKEKAQDHYSLALYSL